MNPNKKVVIFVLLAVLAMLLLSVADILYHQQLPLLEKISLATDFIKIKQDSKPVENLASGNLPLDSISNTTTATGHVEKFTLYNEPGHLINFSEDTTLPVFPLLMKKLRNLKTGSNKKIRIAWLGDSIIEGDLLTQTFRSRMQRFFGGTGVGFVPIKSVSADYRVTVSCKTDGNWDDQNFKNTTPPNTYLHFCGHEFNTADGTVHIKDMTVKDSGTVIEKAIICGYADSSIEIAVNGNPLKITASQPLNRIVVDASEAKELNLDIRDKNLPLYGISLEGTKGIVVDNFSFRGISGVELKKLDQRFLKSLDQNNPYDLIVLEYGTNLMFRPNDVDYTYYYRMMTPVLKNLKKALPGTEFLLISTADRAFKYDDQWKTAIGIDSLLKVQARLAYENDMGFYNMYQSMGGHGTIIRWADSTVSFANKDYIHPNQRGAALLGNMLADAFLKDYERTVDKTAQANKIKH